jgi:hypothetical protein
VSTAVPDGLDLAALAQRIVAVDGVVGVVLGGSRARGEHTPESDVDLGIYYHGDLDIAGLAAIAREVAGPDATITERGEWGRGSTAVAGWSSTASTWTGSTATSTASGTRRRKPTAAHTTGTPRPATRSAYRTSPTSASWPWP